MKEIVELWSYSMYCGNEGVPACPSDVNVNVKCPGRNAKVGDFKITDLQRSTRTSSLRYGVLYELSRVVFRTAYGAVQYEYSA